MKTKKLLIFTGLFFIIILKKFTFAESSGIIKYRQNIMKATAGHMGAIVGVIKNKLPFKDHIEDHAYSLWLSSKMTIKLFPEGSGVGETKAKKSIWENWLKFEKASQNFVVESKKLLEVSKNGDMKSLAIQIRKTGKTCSGCHRNFRKRN